MLKLIMDGDFKVPVKVTGQPESSDESMESSSTAEHDYSSENMDSSDTEKMSGESKEDNTEDSFSEGHEDAPADTHEDEPMEETPESSVTTVPEHVDEASDMADVSKMPNDVDPLVLPVASTPPVKIKHASKIIYGYIGLLILVVIIGGVYVWQHDKVTKLNQKVNSLNSGLVVQEHAVSNLEAQLKKANTKSTPATTLATLGLSETKATRYTPSTTSGSANTGVAVDVTLTNSSASAISLVTSNFKLVDGQSNSYQAKNFPSKTTDPNLPSGYTLLIDQSIASKASVQGSLEFTVPTTSITTFSLVYGTETIPVTVN